MRCVRKRTVLRIHHASLSTSMHQVLSMSAAASTCIKTAPITRHAIFRSLHKILDNAFLLSFCIMTIGQYHVPQTQSQESAPCTRSAQGAAGISDSIEPNAPKNATTHRSATCRNNGYAYVFNPSSSIKSNRFSFSMRSPRFDKRLAAGWLILSELSRNLDGARGIKGTS